MQEIAQELHLELPSIVQASTKSSPRVGGSSTAEDVLLVSSDRSSSSKEDEPFLPRPRRRVDSCTEEERHGALEFAEQQQDRLVHRLADFLRQIAYRVGQHPVVRVCSETIGKLLANSRDRLGRNANYFLDLFELSLKNSPIDANFVARALHLLAALVGWATLVYLLVVRPVASAIERIL